MRSVAKSEEEKGFSIQLVGGATEIGDATGVTFAAPAGKTLSVYVNGSAISGNNVATNVAPSVDTLIVAVASKTVDPIGEKWYESPRVVGKLSKPYADSQGSSYNSDIDAGGNFILNMNGFAGGSQYTSSIGDIVAGGQDGVSADKEWNITGARGGTISTAWGCAIIGVYDQDYIKVMSLSDGSEIATVALKNEDGVAYKACAFAIIDNYLWASPYASTFTDKKLFKYEIPAAGFAGVTELTAISSVTPGCAVKYGFRAAKIGDDTYFYVKGESGLYVGKEGGSFTNVGDGSDFAGKRYDDIAITSDKIYYATASAGKGTDTAINIAMYDLDPATGWITGEGVVVNIENLDVQGPYGGGATDKRGCSIFVTDDEETLVFGGNLGLFAIQYCPQYDVTFKVADSDDIVVKVYEGEKIAEADIPADPIPAAGYEFKGWFDADGNEFNADAVVTAAATYTAKIEAAALTATIELDGATAPDGWTVGEGVATKEFTVESEAFELPALVKADFEFKGYVEKIDDNTYSTETNATVTIDKGTATSKTYKACFEEAAAQPEVKPGEGETTVEVKANNQTDAEAAGIAAIVAPTGVDKTTYQGYFKATAVDAGDGKWNVTVELNPEFVTPTVDTTEETPMAITDSSVTVSVGNVKPGLWYGLEKSATLATGAEFKPTGTFQQATSTGSISVEAPKVATENAAFFKILVSPVNPIK